MQKPKKPNQSKTATALKAGVVKILELQRWDETGDVQCLIKYKGIAEPEWVPVDAIKRMYPLLLIAYYETRIFLRKNERTVMAFDTTDTKQSNERKLVVIQWTKKEEVKIRARNKTKNKSKK